MMCTPDLMGQEGGISSLVLFPRDSGLARDVADEAPTENVLLNTWFKMVRVITEMESLRNFTAKRGSPRIRLPTVPRQEMTLVKTKVI